MITERPRKVGYPREFEYPAVEAAHGFSRPVEAEVSCTLEAQDRPVVYYMGERIYFRPLELEDEPLLRRWINDPRVWRYLYHRGPKNALAEREYIESLGKNPGDYTFGIVVRDGDRLIGSTGLHNINWINQSALFGLMIGDVAYHSRGYGTEATKLALKFGFQELNLHRIALSVYSDNWRAIRVYQKAGFVHEGCLRQALYRNGRYMDEYRFAILREEWNRLQDLHVPESAYLRRLRSDDITAT